MARLEQVRAKFAWAKVSEAARESWFDEYVGLVKKMPALITTNGLGQALAFLAQKAGMNKDGAVRTDTAHGRVFGHIQEWLRTEVLPYRGPFLGSRRGSVLEDLMESDTATYLRATSDAMGVLNYLRLFASGLAKETTTHGGRE